MRGLATAVMLAAPLTAAGAQSVPIVRLPQPRTRGEVSLEEALARRRSVRAFADRPLALAEVAQLLWSAQGVTSASGGRTAPSAGALYPLELFVVAGDVTDLAPGIYRYRPASHDLARVAEGDHRRALAAAALGQSSPAGAPVVFVITGVYERTTGKYGDRGVRYVHVEAGLAAENLCLAAAAEGLGAVVVGAFDDARVGEVLGLTRDLRPLLLVPVGRPRGRGGP
jgi:SagB-type dehydrogenase family enzyme